MNNIGSTTLTLNSTAKNCLGTMLLMIGCLIYLLFRSKTLYIYLWCKSLGLSALIDKLRFAVLDWSVPDFIKYSLPDGLYCAAYLFIMDAIWHDEKNKVKYLLISIVPIITITSEMLQIFNVVPGTFDIMDLVCYCIPPFTYMAIFITNKFMFNNLKIKNL